VDADQSGRVPALPLLAGNLLAVALLGLVLLGAVFSGNRAVRGRVSDG